MNHNDNDLECIAHTRPGAQRKPEGKACCEDRIFVLSDAQHSTAVLCDGCGSASHGLEAAAITSRLICRLIHQNFIRYFTLSPSALRAEIMNNVESTLLLYAIQNGLSAQSLACTIVAASLDIKGRMISLHLGDGGILSRSVSRLQWSRVSLPETGMLKSQTFHTMNAAPEHLRLYRCADICAMLIYSDGIEGIPRFDFSTVLDDLSEADDACLQRFMITHQNGDDQSMALLRLRQT